MIVTEEKVITEKIVNPKPTHVDNSFVEEKKENAKKVLFENNTPELYMENLKKNFAPTEVKEEKKEQPKPKIQFEAAETFFQEVPKAKEKKQATGQVSFSSIYSNKSVEEVVSVSKQEIVEPEIKEEIFEETLPEGIQELQNSTEIIETVEEQKQTNKKSVAKSKTRFKIFIFGLVGVLACMIGWAIWNSVEIKTLTAEMEQANKIYSVNVFSHISNLSKADDLTNENSIINLEKLSDAEIIPIQPIPQKKEEFNVKSNWFDRLCNWLSGFFK